MSHRAPRVAPAGLADRDAVWLAATDADGGDRPTVRVDDTIAPAAARFELPGTIRRSYTDGLCGRVLWPLLHGFPSLVQWRDSDWAAYVAANDRFAVHAVELGGRDATVWIHDYHLLLVGRALRALGHRGRIGLMLHAPFPIRDVLDTVRASTPLVAAMCELNVIGFQTPRSAANFAAAAARSARPGQLPEVGVLPIPLDAAAYRAPGDDTPEIAGLRAGLGDRRLLIAVDPLDPAMGIPERLEAFDRLLDRSPQWRRRITLLQIATPGATDHPEIRHRIETLVGRINGRFGETDWVPILYIRRDYPPAALGELFRLADVAVVTPLRDATTPTPRAFLAAQARDGRGVLVLSQYAGAAESLTGALITNPYHRDGLAADLDHALQMPPAERAHRHRMLAAALDRDRDPAGWTEQFLARLARGQGAVDAAGA